MSVLFDLRVLIPADPRPLLGSALWPSPITWPFLEFFTSCASWFSELCCVVFAPAFGSSKSRLRAKCCRARKPKTARMRSPKITPKPAPILMEAFSADRQVSGVWFDSAPLDRRDTWVIVAVTVTVV